MPANAPNDTKIPDTLLGQAAALAEGEVTATGLDDAAIERIGKTQGTLNAFRTVISERALREAAEADRRLAAGDRAPLLGVPVAVKDDTDVEGETTPFGCGGHFPVAAEDARLVDRLTEAGAIVVGKTNAPEIGQWPLSDSRAFGNVRNPWNPERTPGGSSGGSSAAVAAGLVAAAVGSDGGGSVRIPASWTNLVGIKPSRGRISSYPAIDYGFGLSVNGPLARTVSDAAALYDALEGDLHADERYHADEPLDGPLLHAAERDPGALKIAVVLNAPMAFTPNALDLGVKNAVLRIADVLAGLGHEVFEATINYGPIGVTWVIRGANFCRSWVERHVADPKSQLDPRTRASAQAGAAMRPLLRPAIAAEPGLARRAGKIFERADVVLMPTTAEPPLRAGAIDDLGEWATNAVISRACPYTFAWNVLGWPGISVPAGILAGDLPVGAQLLGRTGDEPRLVSLAAQLEASERWHERRPDPSRYGLA